MKITTKHFELAVYVKGDESAAKLALVLPGKLDTKDYPHMRSHVDFLSRKGYLALSFDPPGTWDSSGGMELYTMTNYLLAIDELIEHLRNRPTILVGHSRGGSVAMMSAIQNPHVTGFISIMSQAGPSRLDESRVVDGVFLSSRDLPDDPAKKKDFKLSLNFYEDSKKYDMMFGLQTCKKQKCFIYGIDDNVITPEQVKEAYNSAAEPKQLIVFDSDHDYRNSPVLIQKMNEVIGQVVDGFDS